MFQRLQHGEEYTISFEGTSQYAHGGLSSCGIAALNAVRVILCAEADIWMSMTFVHCQCSRARWNINTQRVAWFPQRNSSNCSGMFVALYNAAAC
ncbi:hypothetical protein SISSUDRAFT_127167 [Sistotremastrum suecicum HHB10207 ss-3]|uniref:Uncharacterized protein n=1 Tax=Sistotremastrum suecicum HHB10207 ss-3 TaxID=1314776 RepID=A0A166AXX7_9AGAM|nr:hypothetical protein SISSUDRAFT_127167 [Sistotremastrum suecicum HHB10207 ss-3]